MRPPGQRAQNSGKNAILRLRGFKSEPQRIMWGRFSGFQGPPLNYWKSAIFLPAEASGADHAGIVPAANINDTAVYAVRHHNCSVLGPDAGRSRSRRRDHDGVV